MQPFAFELTSTNQALPLLTHEMYNGSGIFIWHMHVFMHKQRLKTTLQTLDKEMPRTEDRYVTPQDTSALIAISKNLESFRQQLCMIVPFGPIFFTCTSKTTDTFMFTELYCRNLIFRFSFYTRNVKNLSTLCYYNFYNYKCCYVKKFWPPNNSI